MPETLQNLYIWINIESHGYQIWHDVQWLQFDPRDNHVLLTGSQAVCLHVSLPEKLAYTEIRFAHVVMQSATETQGRSLARIILLLLYTLGV